MKDDGLTFHHPLAFWLGCAAIVIGVMAHLPMFVMGAAAHYRLAGMPINASMLIGMAVIPLGVLLAGYGLMPRLAQLRCSALASDHLHFHIADAVPLNTEHWKLVVVLAVALTVDVMKPATLGFVMPGVSSEYGITRSSAGLLALVALIGTALGSIAWGRLADLLGRRAAILLSALMFMGTAICGAMPAFGWNLAMCFMMGAAAGGMLPIAYTLMAETIPAAHRGWLLVALGGIGTSAGYLAASGAATLLEPAFSWRALWLLNLPTGALIVFLNRFIPESPRFLSNAGLQERARTVLRRFSGSTPLPDETEATNAVDPLAFHGQLPDEQHAVVDMRALLRGRHARITVGLCVCGLSWGLVNFGFLLWLPGNLVKLGVDAHGASEWLAQSAVLALPGIGAVVWLYQRWSSIRTLVLFIALTALALIGFFVIGMADAQNGAAVIVATVVLLIAISGVISTLIPYAAEIYPVRLRGTGSGLVAASSKTGGILGAGLGVLGLFDQFALSALVLAAPMAIAAIVLLRAGIETRGYALEAVQDALENSSGSKTKFFLASKCDINDVRK